MRTCTPQCPRIHANHMVPSPPFPAGSSPALHFLFLSFLRDSNNNNNKKNQKTDLGLFAPPYFRFRSTQLNPPGNSPLTSWRGEEGGMNGTCTLPHSAAPLRAPPDLCAGFVSCPPFFFPSFCFPLILFSSDAPPLFLLSTASRLVFDCLVSFVFGVFCLGDYRE